ncbi:MAG: hypothetical protein AAGG68_15520 [Bacteroidota bacterium]
MKRSIFLSLTVAICFLWSCECEDLTPTVIDEFPDPFFVVEYGVGPPSIGNQIFIGADFSAPVDTSTVRIGESVLFEGLDELRLDFSFGSSLSFSGIVSGCNQNSTDCEGTIRIIFKGNGDVVIRSEDGQILDGDKDGSDGGDFVLPYTF